MKKFLSTLSIVLLLNNIFIFNVFAGVQIDIQSIQIKVNNGPSYTGDVEAYPGDDISILLMGKNSGDSVSNLKLDFTFSNSNFLYNNTNLKTYINDKVVNENISTTIFNPGVLNSLPFVDLANTGDYLDAYFLDLNINQNTSDNVLTITSQISSNSANSNILSRNIYINSNPHIIDYYFEKLGVQTTQLTRGGGDSIDLIFKIKDYNDCTDIDNGSVVANLSALGLSSTEVLTFVSCSSNLAIYKKAGITTIIPAGTINFIYSDFNVTDESGNINKPYDSLTTFDDEDKKTNLNLEIVSAGSPEVTLNIDDNYIGGSTNLNTNINFSGNQNGDYKIILGDDLTCSIGTILRDWTPYIAGNTEVYNLNSSILSEGDNNIIACLKNDESLIGSFNDYITKDTVIPSISTLSATPGNVVLDDSIFTFTCSENGDYIIEKGGINILGSGIFIGSGGVLANIVDNHTVSNSDIDINSNDFYVYCLDEAENNDSGMITINKTTLPPSFVGGITNFIDNDNDLEGLDGKDISISWDNTIGINYDFFQSYQIFILPTGIDLDRNIHSSVSIRTDKNVSSFLGTSLLLNDSFGNTLVSGEDYRAIISIMGTNGFSGAEGYSLPTTLTGDNVIHSIVTGAKFTTSNNLELTTDATLDTDIVNHDATLISFDINGTSFIGTSISSIDGNKININISDIGGSGVSGINLLVQTGAIRSEIGGFNDNQSFLNITDGQSPFLYNFLNNSTSLYNNFHTGSVNIGYAFLEDMNIAGTRIEIIRFSGNIDSTEYIVNILGDNLLLGIHNQDIDLSALGLVDGVNYQYRLVGTDLAGNYSSTDYKFDLNYDSVGPDQIIQNIISLYSTINPELTWNIPLDNNGNGSGIKQYNLEVFDGNDCSGILNQSHTVFTNSKILTTLTDITDYSWKVVAIDNVLNSGVESICSNFRVDSTTPLFTNSQIKDTILNSTSFFQQGNSIEVSSNLTFTDSDHIWADLSQITGNVAHNNELCSSPSAGITCTYVGNIVTYSFNAGISINDSVKQVVFVSQNVSGGNEVEKIISTTADSNAPIIDAGAILTPTGINGGLTSNISVTWDQLKITDFIGIDNIQIDFSTGALIWNNIGSSINIGSIDWDISTLISGADYKIKLTAFDAAGNSTELISSLFEIDNTNPTVPSNTITTFNGNEIIGGAGTENIIWNSGSIIDNNLNNDSIELYYSSDSGSNWILIEDNLTNSGIYSWIHPNINSETVLLKLVISDIVGNSSNDISDNVFIIDSINPTVSFDFASTPVDGSYLNNSSFDVISNIGDIYMDNVSYIFQNLTTGEYFNGASFSGITEILNTVCIDPIVNGTNNSCDILSFNIIPTIIDGYNYRLQLKALDEAGNFTLSNSVDYIGDITNPNLSISTSSGTYFKDSINISGTSSDLGSGISSVKIQIKKGTDYWDGSNFIAGIQTLNTQTIDNFNNWSYDFSYIGADSEFEVIVIAYDKSYKVNNITQSSILINKDTTIPSILGGEGLFTSPLLNDVYIGGSNINILWNNLDIIDNGAGLKTDSINLDYLDGSNWISISTNETNDGSYIWNSDLLDSNNVKIRLSITDNVENIAYQNSDIFVIDSIAPTISSVETMDLDANGEIDALNIIMSEEIQDSSIVLGDFVISDSIGVPTSLETGNTTNDNIFILKFVNIGDTSTTPSISYTKGSLIDIAGKFLETDNYTLAIDKSSPRILSTEMFDTDGNGKFDKITSVFSENLNSTIDTSVWDIENILIGMSIDSVSVSGNIANIILNESDEFNTAIGSMGINFTANSNWTDLKGNQAGSVIVGTIDDKAKPVSYNAEYFDINGNYKVDKVDIIFSEDLVQFITTDFIISGLDKNSGTLNGNIISFDITETNSDNDTGVVSSFNFTSGNLKDPFNNFVDNIVDSNIDDRVAPKLLNTETQDTDGNAKIDNIILTYSESLNDDFSAFIGVVDTYNISSYSKGLDTQIILNVDEKAGYDSGITPDISINSNSSLFDLNGNYVEVLINETSIDKVGPVITGSRYDEGLHKIFINTSEDIDITDYLISNFVLNGAGTYSIVGLDFTEKSITLTGETIVFGTSKIAFKTDSIGDTLGNKQVIEYFTEIAPSIIINEIMISDTTANNYLELYNLSSSDVDISNYTIVGITIPALTILGANGYYLISKDAEINSILNITPDLIDANLNISGTELMLNNGSMNIDFASLTTGLSDTITPKSIERKESIGDGLLTDSWYTAQDSVGFDDLISLGTPGTINVFDVISPVIGAYYPSDNILFATGKFKILIDYTDEIGGLGIDTNSDTLSLTKWDGSIWGTDLSGLYVDLGGKNITATGAEYNVSSLPFGKYKIDFTISDGAGNNVLQTIIFYVDEFEFNLNDNSINIGTLASGFNTFSANELILTIETVGAGFNIDMLKSGLLTNNGTDIIDFDGNTGFGYDQDNTGYSGIITSIGNSVNIANEIQNINTNGNKNIFTYRLKYGAKIDVTQGAGIYNIVPEFKVLTNY